MTYTNVQNPAPIGYIYFTRDCRLLPDSWVRGGGVEHPHPFTRVEAGLRNGKSVFDAIIIIIAW